MLRQYSDNLLGTFVYDDDVFSVTYYCGRPILHYIGVETDNHVVIPKGLKNASYMFMKGDFPNGLTVSGDTDMLESCEFMFYGADIYGKLTLGFDTSCVDDFVCMFKGTTMPEKVECGENFVIGHANIAFMFEDAEFSLKTDLSYFKFGDSPFETNNMFKGAKFPAGYVLNLDTGLWKNFKEMFEGAVLPKGFTLCSKFVVSEDAVTEDMFLIRSPLDTAFFELPMDVVKMLKENKQKKLELSKASDSKLSYSACIIKIKDIIRYDVTCHTSHSLGELKEILMNEGYSEDDACRNIVRCLGHMHVAD